MNSDERMRARLERWEAHRARGKTHFVLVRGMLQWGIASAFLWAAGMAWLQGKDFATLLTVALVIFPIGGILWGVAVWNLMERKRQKHAGSPRG